MKADGGPTKNKYLMQFQSDIAGCEVAVSQMEELSGIGAAFMAGMKLGLWKEDVYDTIKWNKVSPEMETDVRKHKYDGYKKAVDMVRRK